MTTDHHITSKEDLKAAVRADTQYDDNIDELPDSTLEAIISNAMLRVEMKTGSTEWYSDPGLGLVLLAYTCMRCKAAVENVVIDEYQLGNQRVRTKNADPDTNQQIQQWAADIRDGLNASKTYKPQRPTMQSTGDFVGGSYIHDQGTRH